MDASEPNIVAFSGVIVIAAGEEFEGRSKSLKCVQCVATMAVESGVSNNLFAYTSWG